MTPTRTLDFVGVSSVIGQMSVDAHLYPRFLNGRHHPETSGGCCFTGRVRLLTNQCDASSAGASPSHRSASPQRSLALPQERLALPTVLLAEL